MTKEQIVAELNRLYRLRDEGKKVDHLIEKLEAELCEKMGCEDEQEEE